MLLLTGAAELVTDAILGLYLELDYVQREVSQDGAGVRCVRVDPEDEPLDEVQRRIWSALADLIATTPELARLDAARAPRRDIPRRREDAPELDDIEALAEHLLPSGDEILDSLMHDIQRERSVYADSQLFRALPVDELATEDLSSLGPQERAAAHRRATALAGCLIQASVMVVDQLIEDVTELRKHEGTQTSESRRRGCSVICLRASPRITRRSSRKSSWLPSWMSPAADPGLGTSGVRCAGAGPPDPAGPRRSGRRGG